MTTLMNYLVIDKNLFLSCKELSHIKNNFKIIKKYLYIFSHRVQII